MRSTRWPALIGIGGVLALASCGGSTEESRLPIVRCEPSPVFFELATREMAPRVVGSPDAVRAVRLHAELVDVPSEVAGLARGAWIVAVKVDTLAGAPRWARFVVDEITIRRGAGGVIVPLGPETRELTSWEQSRLGDPDVRELAAQAMETVEYGSSATCVLGASSQPGG